MREVASNQLVQLRPVGGNLKLVLYAPWLETAIRCWAGTSIAVQSVPLAAISRLRGWRLRGASFALDRYPRRNSPLRTDLRDLLPDEPREHILVWRSLRRRAPEHCDSDERAWRQLSASLCSRDEECDGVLHAWLGLPAPDGDGTLVWHVNRQTFGVVPPSPVRIGPA